MSGAGFSSPTAHTLSQTALADTHMAGPGQQPPRRAPRARCPEQAMEDRYVPQCLGQRRAAGARCGEVEPHARSPRGHFVPPGTCWERPGLERGRAWLCLRGSRPRPLRAPRFGRCRGASGSKCGARALGARRSECGSRRPQGPRTAVPSPPGKPPRALAIDLGQQLRGN